MDNNKSNCNILHYDWVEDIELSCNPFFIGPLSMLIDGLEKIKLSDKMESLLLGDK